MPRGPDAGNRLFAVGTPITECPPPRSGRARLRHPAPTSVGNGKALAPAERSKPAPGEDSRIGPVGATLLVIKVAQPEAFRSGRHFAAWIGLTPKDHSTAERASTGRGRHRWAHYNEGARFARDSPLEGDGFELLVPRHERRGFLYIPGIAGGTGE